MIHAFLVLTGVLSLLLAQASHAQSKITLTKGDDVVLVGSGMGSRMIHYGHFETEIFLRHITHDLTIRNLCDEGNTPGFRPHPSREQEEQRSTWPSRYE